MRKDFSPPPAVRSQIIKDDRRQPCAYKGQRFDITRVDGENISGVLGCGHVYTTTISAVALLEPLDKLSSRECCSREPIRKPKKRRKQERKVAEEQSNGIEVYGYFAFTREVGETYADASSAREAATKLELDPGVFVPPEPEERTVISDVIREASRGLKSQKMALNKVTAKSGEVRYDLVGPDPVDAAKRTVIGSICWHTEKGLSFPDMSVDHPVAKKAMEAYHAVKEALTRKDWTNLVRTIFLERWNGFTARNGGVVYWVCPDNAEEVQNMIILLQEVTGLSIVVTPCLDAPTAYSILVAGVESEAEALDKRKMAPVLGRSTREALLAKAKQARDNTGIPESKPLKELLIKLQTTIDSLPTENPPKKGKKKAEPKPAVKSVKEEASAPAPAPAPAPEAAPAVAPPPPAAAPPPPPALEAPALPPPPPEPEPARQPDATVVINGEVIALYADGAIADNMHAYSRVDGGGAEDCSWLPLEGKPGVYFCWFGSKLYTSAALDG